MPEDLIPPEKGPAAAAGVCPLIGHCAAWVRAARGWQRGGMAFAAGFASILAMPPFFLAPVLAVTLPVLVWLIDGVVEAARLSAEGTAAAAWRRSAWPAARIGWLFGFGYHLIGLSWIGEAFLVEPDKFAWLLPFAVTSLPAAMAIYFGLALAVLARFWPSGSARILALAVALAVAEWLRGHLFTGFPWNVLGEALTWPLPLMQAVSVIGIYELTIVTVVVFASPLVVLADAVDQPAPRRGRWGGFVLAGVVLAVLLAAGAARLTGPDPQPFAGARVRLVQPSIPQHEKWRPERQREFFEQHLADTLRSPSGAIEGLAGITHVIWAEAAMPFLPLDSPDAIGAIANLLPDDTRLIAGGLRLQWRTRGSEMRREAYNSLIVFDATGASGPIYDKIHLVPFGEYLPLQGLLESIGLEQLSRMRGGFAKGPQPRPILHIPGLPPLVALICYEAVFPTEVVQGSERPGLIVNITNDGWFGATIGPPEHFHAARLRAVEEGLPLIRVANNGISAVVDYKGRILASMPLDARGVLDSAVPGAGPPTLYGRFGKMTFWVLVLAAVAWLRWGGRIHR